jgi:hypothetical protein
MARAFPDAETIVETPRLVMSFDVVEYFERDLAFGSPIGFADAQTALSLQAQRQCR